PQCGHIRRAVHLMPASILTLQLGNVLDGAPDVSTLWLTAALARRLLENGRDIEVYFGRALNLLSAAWADGTLHSAPITATAMMLPLFHVGGQTDDAGLVEGCRAALLTAVNDPETDPADIITIAHAALNTRYAGNELYIAARNRALSCQENDGGWAAADAMHRPMATVDALMLLRWGGML
ncbi:MAG: hypothetical protein AAF125_12280, partial [Chloroflexota bacterium]